MRWNRERSVKLAVVGLLLLLSTLTACTVSAAGGIIGGAGAITFALCTFLSATSQSGCGPGPHLGPCLSQVFIPEDAGPIENIENVADASPYIDLGVCLSVAMPPDAGPDARMGPCLSPKPPPDVGPCLSPPYDVGPCLTELFESNFGPLDEDTNATDGASIGEDRKASIDKLEAKLPDDVMRRLRRPGDGEVN